MYTYINLFQLNVKSVYMYSQENINSKDTIFAECSGKGKSSVKIFRISGDKAREIALSFNPKISLNPRQVSYINLYYPNSNNLIDKAIVISSSPFSLSSFFNSIASDNSFSKVAILLCIALKFLSNSTCSFL